MTEIHFTFYTIVTGIIKLFLLMLPGYFAYRMKFIDDDFIDKLSLLLIRIVFPALIISKTITYFTFGAYWYWWALVLAAIGFSLSGMAIGAVLLKVFKGIGPRKELMCASGFQNSGYLPMTLIFFSFGQAVADRLLVHMFLFIAGFNLLMWSFVPLFLKNETGLSFNYARLLNPPVVATFFSLLWVAILGHGSMPGIIMAPLGQLGQASFPLSMMILGAYLCRYRGYVFHDRLAMAAGIAAKLIIFPAIVLAMLILVPMNSYLRFFLFLEAIMPSAVSLVVVGAYTSADNKFFSSVIFYSHVIAILSIPMWLEVFRFVFRA